MGVPIRNAQNVKSKTPSCWTVGCGFWIVVFVFAMFLVPRDSTGKVIEKQKTAEELKTEKKQQLETAKRLKAIGDIISASGGTMEVSSSTIRITLPGAVSEYEAQRVAKMVSDRTGTFHVIRVYDNAGLLRAKI